jgi:predicted nucleic acid-binding protein
VVHRVPCSTPHLPAGSTETVDLVRDSDDNRLIEAARTGGADVIVTGDQDLLSLESVGQISIMPVREFLETVLSAP